MSTTETRDATYALGGRLTDGNLLKTWGAAVTGGWIVSQLVALAGVGSQLALTAFWLIGSLVASFAVIVQAISVDEALILGGLWFAGPAVGFLITAAYMNDWSRQLYAGAAVANLVAAVLVVTVSSFEAFYFIVAAVIQGLPMLYHGTRLE